MALKQCDNCGQEIGNLEDFQQFGNSTVCESCYSALSEESDILSTEEYSSSNGIKDKDLGKNDGFVPDTSFFSYEGRINRAKYFLIMLLIGFVGFFVITIWASASPESSFLGNIILVIFASFPVVKRWHDIDKSGANYFWSLVPIANLVAGIILLFRKGTIGSNQYGPDPLINHEVN